MLRSVSAIAAIIALTSGTSATAAVLVYSAQLTGLQEVPVVVTPGKGLVTVFVDTTANTMRVKAGFSGLLGNTTAAHIHCCTPFGVNAGVATTTPSFPGFPLGVKSGGFDQTYDMTLASSFRAGFITANGGSVASARAALFNGIAARQSYFNLHSASFPGGEIRGQLGAVPEPATWGMMLAGFAAVGIAFRRRRRIPAFA